MSRYEREQQVDPAVETRLRMQKRITNDFFLALAIVFAQDEDEKTYETVPPWVTDKKNQKP